MSVEKEEEREAEEENERGEGRKRENYELVDSICHQDPFKYV